jgi:hypothetical protein
MPSSCYLVVKTVDVTETPIAASVTAVFSKDTTVVQTWGSSSSTVTSPAPTGVFEALIPDGVNRIHVEVTPPDPFWPATQDVTVDTTASPPTIAYVGGQGPNTDILAVHSRGTTDFNLELPFVVLQVRDATDTVNQRAAQLNARTGDYANVGTDLQPISFDVPTISKSRFGTPLINGSGSNFTLLNHSAQDIPFNGTLFFVERRTVPKLLAVVHPGWPPPESLEDAVKTPIPFHLFFPPVAPWVDTYPYGAKYLDFAYRYLLVNYDQIGHAMLYQNVADSQKVVFVLPVPSNSGTWVGDAATQKGLWLLLQELAYFLQRKKGASWPLQEVSSVSLSCFSAGATWLAAVLAGGKGSVPDFLTQKLKNVFVFDGVPDNNSESAMQALCKSLASWFQSTAGRTDRNLRVYTAQARWFDELQKYLKLPVSATAPGGAREVDSDACTLLVAPMTFWMKINGWYSDWRSVHFSFPALFMEHAVTNSTF